MDGVGQSTPDVLHHGVKGRMISQIAVSQMIQKTDCFVFRCIGSVLVHGERQG